MIKIYVVIVIAVFIRQCYCQNIVQSVSVSPVNTSVPIGGDVIFRCTVNNPQGELTWCRDGFCTFGRNRGIKNTRFSIIENSTIINNITIVEFNLSIKNVTLDDNVAYQCQVSGTNKSYAVKSNIAYLKVLIQPNVVRLSPNNPKINNDTIRVVLKQNITIECTSENSNPVADFSWYLDNQPIVVGVDGVFDISKRIDITPNVTNKSKLVKTIGKIIIRADNELKWNGKLLKCEAYAENKTLSIISDTKPVIVNYISSIVSIMKQTPGDLLVDEIYKFECLADARPPVSRYTWFIDGFGYFSSGPDEKYFTLKMADNMHKKQLKCNVTHELELRPITAVYPLDITYGPRIIEKLPSHKMVQLFDTLNLACLVDSNPQASYYWKLNGTVVFSYQNYSILSMNNDNYGTYTCEASLKNYPKVTTSVKVIKPGPPIIDAVIEQYGSNGYETRIETVTENEPMANNIEWYSHGKFISRELIRSGKYNILSPEPIPDKGYKHTLTITDLNSSDFTNYTFVARNSYGSSSVEIKLLEASTNFSWILLSAIGSIFVFLSLGVTMFILHKHSRKNKKKNPKIKKKSKFKRLNNNNFPFFINRNNFVDKVKPKSGFYRAVPIKPANIQIPNFPSPFHPQLQYSLPQFQNNNFFSPELYEVIQTPDENVVRSSNFQTDV